MLRGIYPLSLVGESPSVAPNVLARTDGVKLLYPGLIHWAAGEPESLKSWLMLLACAQELQLGRSILYLDYEDAAPNIRSRLLALGVPEKRLTRAFYCQPEGQTTQSVMAQYLSVVSEHRIGLVIIDGVTEAMTMEGLALLDNTDIAKWMALLPRPLANTGAAIGTIDHVTKNGNGGRFAIGGQHKLAGAHVSYMVDCISPLAPAKDEPVTGIARLVVSKDRPGVVRANSLERKYPGKLYLTAKPDGTVYGRIISESEKRPVQVMEEVCAYLATVEHASSRRIRDALKGRHETKDLAVRFLVSEGFVGTSAEGFFLITPFVDAPPPFDPWDLPVDIDHED